MAERMYPQIIHAETLWQEGQIHQARAALSSIALNTSAKWWARLESLQILARWGLKDEAISIAKAMLGELPAGGDEKIRLEIAQLLARLGQTREAAGFILAILRAPFPLRPVSALDTLATLGCLEEIANLTRDLNIHPGVLLAAALVLIRFGRTGEGKAVLLSLANPTTEIIDSVWYNEVIRWNAAQALSQFPEQHQLVEQVLVELARNEGYVKVRILAIEKLKERKQVKVLLDIGSDRSTPLDIRNHVAAALMELGHR